MARREQEINLLRLWQEERMSQTLTEQPTTPEGNQDHQAGTLSSAGSVAQSHVRASEIAFHILRDCQITPIVLHRDIYDSLTSLVDRIRAGYFNMSMGHVTQAEL